MSSPKVGRKLIWIQSAGGHPKIWMGLQKLQEARYDSVVRFGVDSSRGLRGILNLIRSLRGELRSCAGSVALRCDNWKSLVIILPMARLWGVRTIWYSPVRPIPSCAPASVLAQMLFRVWIWFFFSRKSELIAVTPFVEFKQMLDRLRIFVRPGVRWMPRLEPAKSSTQEIEVGSVPRLVALGPWTWQTRVITVLGAAQELWRQGREFSILFVGDVVEGPRGVPQWILDQVSRQHPTRQMGIVAESMMKDLRPSDVVLHLRDEALAPHQSFLLEEPSPLLLQGLVEENVRILSRHFLSTEFGLGLNDIVVSKLDIESLKAAFSEAMARLRLTKDQGGRVAWISEDRKASGLVANEG